MNSRIRAMTTNDLDRFLSELERSPERGPEQREQVRHYARRCMDQILALGGPDGDEREKQCLTALLVRAHAILRRPGRR